MKVRCALLASYVEVGENGRLNMIGGGIDTLKIVGRLPTTPTRPLYFVGKLEFDPPECGREYRVRVEFSGPQGMVEESNMSYGVPQVGPGYVGKLFVLANFYNYTLPTVGNYVVRMMLEDKEVANLPLVVVQSIGPE